MRHNTHYVTLTWLGLLLFAGCRSHEYVVRVVEGENHTITRRPQVIAHTVTFFHQVFDR